MPTEDFMSLKKATSRHIQHLGSSERFVRWWWDVGFSNAWDNFSFIGMHRKFNRETGAYEETPAYICFKNEPDEKRMLLVGENYRYEKIEKGGNVHMTITLYELSTGTELDKFNMPVELTLAVTSQRQLERLKEHVYRLPIKS